MIDDADDKLTDPDFDGKKSITVKLKIVLYSCCHILLT